MPLEYRDGHYHDDGGSIHERPHGMFQRTAFAWERVLEHVGGTYMRLFERRKS